MAFASKTCNLCGLCASPNPNTKIYCDFKCDECGELLFIIKSMKNVDIEWRKDENLARTKQVLELFLARKLSTGKVKVPLHTHTLTWQWLVPLFDGRWMGEDFLFFYFDSFLVANDRNLCATIKRKSGTRNTMIRGQRGNVILHNLMSLGILANLSTHTRYTHSFVSVGLLYFPCK